MPAMANDRNGARAGVAIDAHEGSQWVDLSGSIAAPRTAGIGASFPFALAPPEVR